MFYDKNYSASLHDLALFVMTCNCNPQQCLWGKLQCFPTWLSFITKLNSDQLNIKKKKSTKIILEKNITKKQKTKETGKKTCEEKLYQFIVFCEEKLVFTCNCNS